MCPSYVATREEKDSTRGRARVLQDWSTAACVAAAGTTRPSSRRSTCACPARVAPATARPASTWRPTSPRRCTSATGAGCGHASHYALGRLPAVGPDDPAAAGQPDAADRAARPAGEGGRRASTRGGACRRSPSEPLRTSRWSLVETSGPAGRRRRLGVGRLVHRPVRAPTAAGRRSRLLEGAGLRVGVIPEAACCALTWITTGQLDQARRILGRRRRRPSTPTSPRACRSSGWSRAAWPPCAPTPRSCSTTPAPARWRAACARWPSCSTGLDGWSPPRPDRCRGGRPAALPPGGGARLGGRPGPARRGPGRRSPGSAAAAGWPATSGSSRATTRCRWRSPSTPCSPPYDGRGRVPSCSPTGSRAAPSSTTSRASAHCTSRSSWRATNRFDPGTGSR